MGKITPELFKKDMEEIERKHGDDTQDFHEVSDQYIIFVLKELGYGEGIEIFERHERWYA